MGDWVHFAVTLYDGTPGFAGVGRCVTVVDNGEDRLSHQRFDVVIDSLQFDSRGQQIFEHILTLNGPGEGEATDDAGYAEPDGSTGSFVDVSEDFRSQPALGLRKPAGGRSYRDRDRADVEAALSRSAMMEDDDDLAVVTMPPPANAPNPESMRREAPVIIRPEARLPRWSRTVTPRMLPRPEIARTRHVFPLSGGLPFPNVPPRPRSTQPRRVAKRQGPPEELSPCELQQQRPRA